MRLPNGITGFYDSNHTKPSQMDSKQFKQLCFTVMLTEGGKVIELKEPENPRNFFEAEIQIFNSKLHILLNEHHPYIAFASSVNFKDIVYIDEPQLSNEFSKYYKVLSVEELNSPISKKSDFSNAEIKQLDYWKPKKVGDMIFNFWD